MDSEIILGIDLGGTNIRGGLVKGEQLLSYVSSPINTQGSVQEVLKEFFAFTSQFIHPDVKAIGIGIPGMEEKGIVYDVVNIPSWKNIPLQELMEEHFQLPVIINNDANCFSLGEFFYGIGRGYSSMAGLTVGTGLGAGLILDNKLYAGNHCGAGEFGMIDYLDKCFEFYASGQFFRNMYGISGETAYSKAKEGNPEALDMFTQLGKHIGNAIKTILYAIDVELIVLGGSVSKALPYFATGMWEQIETFAFKRSLANLRVEASELKNAGILGAAALYYNKKKQSII